MTCIVLRHDDHGVAAMRFSCDATGCAANPSDDDIIAAGGLRAMGWHCAGGRHFCPDHNPQENEPCLSLPLPPTAQRL